MASTQKRKGGKKRSGGRSARSKKTTRKKTARRRVSNRYVAGPAAPFDDDIAHEVGLEMDRIRVAHDGVLTPELIVEAATRPRNVMHTYFTWDNRRAAERHRLSQARRLMGHVQIQIVTSERTIRHRANVRIKHSDDTKPRSNWVPLDQALADPESRAQIVEDVASKLRVWRHQHSQLNELARVWSAIDTMN